MFSRCGPGYVAARVQRSVDRARQRKVIGVLTSLADQRPGDRPDERTSEDVSFRGLTIIRGPTSHAKARPHAGKRSTGEDRWRP